RGLPPPDRHTRKAHLSRLFHAHLRLWLADHRGGHAAHLRGRLEADGSARHRQAKPRACSPADRIDPPDAPRGLENPPQPAVALSQPATDDPPARCDRTGRVHPGAERLRLERRFPAALAASQLRHAHAPAGRGHQDHPDLARPFEPALHGDLHPPDRAAAGPAPHPAGPDHRRPLRGTEAQPWLIPAFTRPRPTSSWPTSSADSVPNTSPNTATG